MYRRLFYSVYLGFFITSITAQNLVPNPSFEQMLYLPNESRLDFDTVVNNWYSGNLITVLSSHINAPVTFNSFFANPSQFQLPRTGLAIAAYKTMEVLNPGYIYQNQRSYPSVKLKSTISMGEKVYGEFWTSYYEGPFEFPSGNHGMYFSKDSIFKNTYKVNYVNPQISESNIISDSVNWVKISGVFIANSDINYISIGNFFEYQDTKHIYNQSLAPNTLARSTYLIDDVKVRVLNPSVTDTLKICKGDSATVIATGEENHQWAFAATPNIIEETDSIFKFYPDSSVTVNFYGSFDTLTTYVLVSDLEIDLGKDTLICKGDEFWLSTKIKDADQIVWNNTTNTDSLKIEKSGFYTVEVTRDACVKHDTIFIEVVNLEEVKIISPPVTCLGDEIKLFVPFQKYANYLWNTGATDTLISVKEDGNYSVRIVHPCGEKTDEIDVFFEKCICHFFVPNAFSPNGDGINDEFYPVFDCSIRSYFISITDRWGNTVFESKNPDERWGGTNANGGIYNVHIFYQGLNEEGQTVGDEIFQILTLIE